MIHKPFVHSKQRERRTPIHTHILSSWQRSHGVEFLAFGCRRVVVSIVVYSGSGWKQRRVGSVTHLIVRHCERTDGADVWSTPTAQSAVGESAANVPTESGHAETAVSISDGNPRKLWRSASCQDDIRCPRLSDESIRKNGN